MYRVKAIERSLDEGGGHATDDTVTATLHFLPRDPLFNEEKPYSIQYTPHGDIPQTNVYQDIVKGVKVRNIRSIRDKFHFNDDGIIMRNFKTQMSYEDFAVPEIVRSVYVPEITQLLRQEMGVHNVAILEYLVSCAQALIEESQRSVDQDMIRFVDDMPVSPFRRAKNLILHNQSPQHILISLQTASRKSLWTAIRIEQMN